MFRVADNASSITSSAPAARMSVPLAGICTSRHAPVMPAGMVTVKVSISTVSPTTGVCAGFHVVVMFQSPAATAINDAIYITAHPFL